jgi:hypothetical protein
MILSSLYPNYVTCPQQAHGAGRVALSAAVGLPIGAGLTCLIMIAWNMGMTTGRSAGSVGATRTAIERAGIGAVYGSILAIFSTLSRPPASSCGTDLLQNLGNAAAWGTLLGFGFGIPAMVRSLRHDRRAAGDSRTGRMYAGILRSSLFIGSVVTFMIVFRLAAGYGWAK